MIFKELFYLAKGGCIEKNNTNNWTFIFLLN